MKCMICGEDIRGRYLMDCWHQAVHDCHKIEYCFSCGRFVKPDDIHLADGRNICSSCATGIVKTVQHTEWVEKRVRAILVSNGVEKLPDGVPIKIVPPSRMAQLSHCSSVDTNHYGLTRTSKMSSLFGSHCNHTVYMLDYLPKIFFAGILAHEFLHVWQNEQGISLPPPLCEGFCNLGSYVVYQSIALDISRFYVKRLEEDAHPVYGDGFRKVKKVYLEQGERCLKKTMQQLRLK